MTKVYNFKDPIENLSYEELIKLENVLANKTFVGGKIVGGTEITRGIIQHSIVREFLTGSELSIQGWQFSGTFSATNYRVVAWTAGTVTLMDGTTFSISGGNTGNMTALTYIYFDKAVSETSLQITTTASTAVGSNKILIAVAQNNADTAKAATFQVFGGTGGIGTFITADNIAANTITANEIAVNTITANELNVTYLSAISADLGSITSGTITLDTASHIKGGQTAYNTGTGFFLGASGGTPTNTGYKSPAATGESYNDWTTPTNAYSSNNTYAVSVYPQNQDYYNFSLIDSIDASADIEGIEVAVEWKKSGAGSATLYGYLSWNGGSSWTSGISISTDSTSDVTQTMGGSANEWGRTWTRTEFSNANFRLRLDNNGGTANVDHIQVKVYYTSLTYKFSIGNGVDQYLAWNGSTLNVIGTISASTVIGGTITGTTITGGTFRTSTGNDRIVLTTDLLAIYSGGSYKIQMNSNGILFDNATTDWLLRGDGTSTVKFSPPGSTTYEYDWDVAAFFPYTDSQLDLGKDAQRWAAVYADAYPASPIEVSSAGIETFKKIKGITNKKGKYTLETDNLPDEFKIKDKKGEWHTELKKTIGICVQTISELINTIDKLENRIKNLENK